MEQRIKQLKERVCNANLTLKKSNLITLTWGNVSEIDRNSGYVVIKPSGVSYEEMRAEDMVVVDLDGNKIESAPHPQMLFSVKMNIPMKKGDIIRGK